MYKCTYVSVTSQCQCNKSTTLRTKINDRKNTLHNLSLYNVIYISVLSNSKHILVFLWHHYVTKKLFLEKLMAQIYPLNTLDLIFHAIYVIQLLYGLVSSPKSTEVRHRLEPNKLLK